MILALSNQDFFFPNGISGDIKEGGFLILCNEICHHSEDLYNSVNQYFPNDQFWNWKFMGKRHSTYKRDQWILISDSTLQLTSWKLSVVEFLCCIREYSQVSYFPNYVSLRSQFFFINFKLICHNGEDAWSVYQRPRRTKKQTETNNTLERISSRKTEAGEWISDLEDRMVEITPTEQNIEKRMKKHEDSLRDHRDNSKHTTFTL